MKSKILPLALLSIFLLALLLIGRPLLSPDRGETGLNQEKEKGPIVIFEPDPKDWSKKGLKDVADFISKKQEEFSSLTRKTLDAKDSYLIGEAYGHGGFLTTHEGESAKGKTAISRYFRNHSRNITDLEFKLEFVYGKELAHILNLKDKRSEEERNRDIVHVVYFFISVSYKFNGKPLDPPSGSNWRHIRMCDWEPDI